MVSGEVQDIHEDGCAHPPPAAAAAAALITSGEVSHQFNPDACKLTHSTEHPLMLLLLPVQIIATTLALRSREHALN